MRKKNPERVIMNEVESSKSQDRKPNSTMRNLLVSCNETIEDKIATVKTAQLIDKSQFETALKTLMKR